MPPSNLKQLRYSTVRLRPKRPHRYRVRPRRNPGQRLPLFPRQRPHRIALSRQHQSLHSRQRRRHLRLRPQFLPPPSLRRGRRYPQTRQQRSQLRPIVQPLLTPLQQRPLPLQPTRPRRLRQIRQPLFLLRHQHPLQHRRTRRHRRQQIHRSRLQLRRRLPYPNLVPTGSPCPIPNTIPVWWKTA